MDAFLHKQTSLFNVTILKDIAICVILVIHVISFIIIFVLTAAVGTCIDCYESLNDTLSGCHSNPVFSEKEHFRSEFVLFSKLSERSIFHLIESTAMEIDVICITKTRMMKVMACRLHLPFPTLQVNYCVGMIF